MKIKSKILRLLQITFFAMALSSCSEISDEPNVKNESFPKILIDVDNRLGQGVKEGRISNPKEAISFARQFPDFTGFDCPSDSFVSLYFGEYEYFIDFGGRSRLAVTEEPSDFNIDEVLDEYDTNLGIKWPVSSSIMDSRAGNPFITGLLKKHNVLVWNLTAEESNFSEVTGDLIDFFDKLKKKGRNVNYKIQNYCFDKGINTAYMLEQLKNIHDYDVVYLIAHGDVYGRTLMPRDGSFDSYCPIGIVCNEDNSYEDYYALTYDWLDKNITTKDLSKTIIWTASCYIFKEGGPLYDFCVDKKVADFYGADQPVYWELSFEKFKWFYSAFINGTPSHRAYSLLRRPEKFESLNCYGYWRMITEYHSVAYPWPFIETLDREIKATFLFYEGFYNNLFSKTSNRASTIEQTAKVGFLIKNLADGTVTYIPVSNKLGEGYKTYNGIEAITYKFDDSVLPKGEYLCRTYIEYVDGTKQISQNECKIDIAEVSGSYTDVKFKGFGSITETKYKVYPDGTSDWAGRVGPIESNNSSSSIKLYEVNENQKTKYFIGLYTKTFIETDLLIFEVGGDFQITHVSRFDEKPEYSIEYSGVIHSYIENGVIFANISYTGKYPAQNQVSIVNESFQIALDGSQGSHINEWSVTEPSVGNDKNAIYINVREGKGQRNLDSFNLMDSDYILNYSLYPNDGSGKRIIYYNQ